MFSRLFLFRYIEPRILFLELILKKNTHIQYKSRSIKMRLNLKEK